MSDDGLDRFHSGGWCKTCGREWTGNSECHCASCCQHFTSESAFDRHLAHPNALEDCHDPAHILDRKNRRVFEQIQRAHGPVWRIRQHSPHYRSDLPASSNPSFSDSPNSRKTGVREPETSEKAGRAQMSAERSGAQ